MRTGLIVFARMQAQRLPGKMLMPVGARSVLGRVLDRARAAGPWPIVVATSVLAADDAIADAASAEGVDCFRGSLEDVAGRALAAATAHGFTRFARICGDRPFHDPLLLRTLIALAEQADLDLASTHLSDPWPPGLTAEVVRTAALAARHEGLDAAGREHVTQALYADRAGLRLGDLPVRPSCRIATNLTVDTATDLARAQAIADALGARAATAPPEETLAIAATWDRAHAGA